MTTKTDIRWQQRFDNYMNAFAQLDAAVALSKSRSLTELEEQGLIQAFEITHELAWNVLKDYLEYQGISNITGSRDATREAFQNKLITEADSWMEMIKSRNLTSHSYNKKVAKEIVNLILTSYYSCFIAFKQKMSGLVKP